MIYILQILYYIIPNYLYLNPIIKVYLLVFDIE